MCQIGDIIVVDEYVYNGDTLSRHSFVVVDDTEGEIKGLDYNLICNVISSFHNEVHKKKKLKFPYNFEIKGFEQEIANGHQEDGFIKSEQLYFFNKNKIKYRVIGQMAVGAFNALMEFVQTTNIRFEEIIDNL